MTITVVGTPNSGKSEKAEAQICHLSGPNTRYYIATMIPYGEQGRARVEKHKKQREGKGFTTIEQPFDVDLALEKIEQPEKATVLLECISNLAANEMFERHCIDIDRLTEKIVNDVIVIQTAVNNLVIVTNRFEESEGSDEETRNYIKLMNEINKELLKISDERVLL